MLMDINEALKRINTEPDVITIDGRSWTFYGNACRISMPLIGHTLITPGDFYAVVDSEKRIWIETASESGTFHSPCLEVCLIFLGRDTLGSKKVKEWVFGKGAVDG